MELIKIIFERRTFVRAIFVAIVVGIILNLINQGAKIIYLQFDSINYSKMILTFFVPYLVSTYSSVMSKLKFTVGEVSHIDAYLESNCGDTIFVKKGELIPECPNCKGKTKYKLAIKKASEIKRVEEQLTSMALFGELNPAPVFRFDINGQIIESNPAANKILKTDKLVGTQINECISQINKIEIKDIIEGNKITQIVEKIGSSYYKFTVKGVAELSECLMYGSEITEMIEARVENNKLSTAVQQSSNIVIITNTKGEIEFVNRAFETITGYSKREVLGKNPRILKTNYLSSDVYKELWTKISSGKVWEGEFHNRKKNGEKYWEKATISPIMDSNGEIISYLAIKEDITQYRADKLALQSMAMFAELNPEPVFRFNQDFIVLDSNHAANQTFGVETIVGANAKSLISYVENINIAEFIRNNEIITIEEEVDDKIFRFMLRGIKDLSIVQIYGSDITKRRLAEDKVLKQKESIESSIKYAKRIQNAVLPHDEQINKILNNYFIMFKPRDIVSGDFYWINEINERIYVVAADCTGHGVPGAFMSMLGVSFLNEIINKEQTHFASEILNQLRISVKDTLSQTGKYDEAKDGMDIALCIIDKKSMKMQYAGAYNPLYLYRNNELIETSADRMPIGIYIKEKESFTNHEIQLVDGDVFYVFSDGYMDQFGGENGNKFTKRNFKKILAEIHTKPMEEQKQELLKTFDDWKGEFDQIDDVVVIGVKV